MSTDLAALVAAQKNDLQLRTFPTTDLEWLLQEALHTLQDAVEQATAKPVATSELGAGWWDERDPEQLPDVFMGQRFTDGSIIRFQDIVSGNLTGIGTQDIRAADGTVQTYWHVAPSMRDLLTALGWCGPNGEVPGVVTAGKYRVAR